MSGEKYTLQLSPGAARLVRSGIERDDSETGASKAGRIVGWSRRSRARMTLRLAELDYSAMLSQGRPAAMLTLTYPGDWETLVPTGKECKRHFEVFLKRYETAWGESLVCVWKLEFQRRGAPHYHLFLVPPAGRAGESRQVAYEAKLLAWEAAGKVGRKPRRPGEAVGDGLGFQRWAKLVWADIVGETNARDRELHEWKGAWIVPCPGPNHFSQHALFKAKWQQNIPPDIWREADSAPGRYWGYRGLKPRRQELSLTRDEFLQVARMVRRREAREKVDGEWVKKMARKPVRRGNRIRMTSVPVKRMRNQGSGFVLPEDMSLLSADIGRVLGRTTMDEGSDLQV